MTQDSNKVNVAESDYENPFRRHSTLLGFAAAGVVVTVLGWLTQWRESIVPIYIIAGLASLWLFSRAFYGFRSAMLIDKANTAPGSMGMGSRGVPVRWDGRPIENLSVAYEKWRLGDTAELERIAEEEERQNHND
jgi:hypothetical protein